MYTERFSTIGTLIGRVEAVAVVWQEVVDDPTGNKMLLVMDYMEGGPVMTREALERGRCIPEPLALQYFRDMCKVSLITVTTQHKQDSKPALPSACCLCGLQRPPKQ